MTTMRSPNTDRGMIRVVEGTERRWSGIEIVVSEDLAGLSRRLDRHPAFDLRKPVDEADFTHAGANVHAFFHGRTPGLTHAMFTMAVTEAEDYEFPTTENQVGHIFDVHLDLNKAGLSRNFYENTLGMQVVFDEILSDGLFYDTWDLDPSAPEVRMSILKGDAPGFGLGGIEMRCFDSTLLDIAPQIANRLDGGCCMTTFTTTNLNRAYRAVCNDPGAKILTEPVSMSESPYGGGYAFTFLAPDGDRVEISERWTA